MSFDSSSPKPLTALLVFFPLPFLPFRFRRFADFDVVFCDIAVFVASPWTTAIRSAASASILACCCSRIRATRTFVKRVSQPFASWARRSSLPKRSH